MYKIKNKTKKTTNKQTKENTIKMNRENKMDFKTNLKWKIVENDLLTFKTK